MSACHAISDMNAMAPSIRDGLETWALSRHRSAANPESAPQPENHVAEAI